MSDFTLRIDGKALEKLTVGQIQKNMVKAGIYFTSFERKQLNTAQPYTRGKKFRGHNPSKPGEYPHKLTGQLQKSITWHLDKANTVLTVGSNLKGYPGFLESGTAYMKPRPWRTLAWASQKDKLGKIIVGK